MEDTLVRGERISARTWGGAGRCGVTEVIFSSLCFGAAMLLLAVPVALMVKSINRRFGSDAEGGRHPAALSFAVETSIGPASRSFSA